MDQLRNNQRHHHLTIPTLSPFFLPGKVASGKPGNPAACEAAYTGSKSSLTASCGRLTSARTYHLSAMKPILLVAFVAAGLVILTVTPQAGGQGSCRSLEVLTDKGAYAIGESVNLTIKYVHLLPGCAEAGVVHDHLIRVEILDKVGHVEYFSEHSTVGNLTTHETWIPTRMGNYTVEGTSWFRLSSGSLVREMQASKTILVGDSTSVPELPAPALGLIAGLCALPVLRNLAARKGRT
jgi:hypothetical protein